MTGLVPPKFAQWSSKTPAAPTNTSNYIHCNNAKLFGPTNNNIETQNFTVSLPVSVPLLWYRPVSGRCNHGSLESFLTHQASWSFE